MDFFSPFFFSFSSGHLGLEKYKQVYETRLFLSEQQQQKKKSVSVLRFDLDETCTRSDPALITGRPILLKTKYYKKDNNV